MIEAQAFRMFDQRLPTADANLPPPEHSISCAAIEAAIATVSAQARRECTVLGRLVARHATAPTGTARAALEAEITISIQALADLNAELAGLRSALSRRQVSRSGYSDAAA